MLSATTLREEFTHGERLYRQIEDSSLPTVSPDLQKMVDEAIDSFQKCDKMIRDTGVYSRNEELDDISTRDLRLFVVSFYLAETMLRKVGQDRIVLLESALGKYASFLDLCEDYGFQVKDPMDDPEAKLTPEQQRKAKIEKYTKEKQLKESIERLNQETDDSVDDVDEERKRELYLVMIEYSIMKALGSIKICKEELEMLKHMKGLEINSKSIGPSDPKLDAKSTGGLQSRTGPLMDSTGKPRRPFVITSKRQQFKEGVFRPHWNLPTMSIEEYIDNEIARGNFLSGGGEQPEKESSDEDEKENDEAALRQAREWDAFKDDNRRGWGNRMNKG